MSADRPEGPKPEAPQELSSEDLTSIPGTMAAAPGRLSLPSKPVAPPPRRTLPTPPTPPTPNTPATSATPSPPRQVEGQMIRGPRHGTLVGIGTGPRVDETERLVTGRMSPLDTQRRLVEKNLASPAVIRDVPPPAVELVESIAPVPSPATEAAPPPADVAPSSDSANTVARPPVTPPKPADVPAPDDAPKVVIDAPGAERVIPDELKETSISLRRVQLQQDAAASGEHATVIDPARRARGRAIVAAVVGVCGLLLLVGLVVSILRGRHKNDDGETTASTSKGKSTAKIPSTAGTKDTSGVATSTTSSSASTATPTSSDAKSGAVPKGFGRLTVEPVGKAAPANALIYIGEKSYGPLGQPIFVPCGYRWILAGVPTAKGRLGTRLSKSSSVFVQCGASSDTHFKLTLK